MSARVMGTEEYPPLCEKYDMPIVVTGFEPLDILEGIRRTVLQLESGRHELENAYPRAVQVEGNSAAKAMLLDVFEVTDRAWRGIGMIPSSGWRLSHAYRDFDAEHRFSVTDIHTEESPVCRSGEVLQGLIKPHECEAFGNDVHAAQSRSAPRWSRPRAPAPPTTCTGGWRCRMPETSADGRRHHRHGVVGVPGAAA